MYTILSVVSIKVDQTLHQMAQNDPGMSYLSIFRPIWPKLLTKMEKYQNSAWIEHCIKWPEMTLRLHICLYLSRFGPKSWPKWKNTKTGLGSNIAPNGLKWPWDVIFVDISANLTQKVDKTGKTPKLTLDRTLHQMTRNDPGRLYLSIFGPIGPKTLTKMEKYQNLPWIEHCTKWPEMTLACHICRYLGQFTPKSWPKWKDTKTCLGSNIHQMTRNDRGRLYLSIFGPIWHKTLTKMEKYQNSAWIEHCIKWPTMTLRCHIFLYLSRFGPKSWTRWTNTKTHLGSIIAPNDPKWPWEVIFVDIWANLTQNVDQNGKIPKLSLDRTLQQMTQNDPGISYLSIFQPIWSKTLTKMKRYQNSPWIEHCTKWREMAMGCHICWYFCKFDPKRWPKWKDTKTRLGSNIAPNDPKWPWDVICQYLGQFDLSRSLKVKPNVIFRISIYGSLLVSNTNHSSIGNIYWDINHWQIKRDCNKLHLFFYSFRHVQFETNWPTGLEVLYQQNLQIYKPSK